MKLKSFIAEVNKVKKMDENFWFAIAYYCGILLKTVGYGTRL